LCERGCDEEDGKLKRRCGPITKHSQDFRKEITTDDGASHMYIEKVECLCFSPSLIPQT